MSSGGTPATNRELISHLDESIRLAQEARNRAALSPHAVDPSSRSQSGINSISTSNAADSRNSVVQESLRDLSQLTDTTAVVSEFNRNFPGLSRRTSGRELQQQLPNTARPQTSPRVTPQQYGSFATSRGRGRGGRTSYSTWTGRVLNTWTHTFICLATSGATTTPSSEEEEILNKAGLGRKKIVFGDKYGLHQHVRQTLESYFPRLDMSY